MERTSLDYLVFGHHLTREQTTPKALPSSNWFPGSLDRKKRLRRYQRRSRSNIIGCTI
jgi:hypothetical protein